MCNWPWRDCAQLRPVEYLDYGGKSWSEWVDTGINLNSVGVCAIIETKRNEEKGGGGRWKKKVKSRERNKVRTLFITGLAVEIINQRLMRGSQSDD